MNAALQSQLEILLLKGTLLALLGTVISYMALMWSAFTVLKYGIKEGLLAYDREKRKPAWSKTAAANTAPGVPPSGFKWVLVPDEALPHSAMPMDMKAD